MIKTAKKVMSLMLALTVALLMLSFTATAEPGDLTGGEEYLDQLGHVLTFKSEKIATCQEGGYKTYHCEICDQDYTFDYKDPVDHVESEWITDVAPTTETTGQRHKECIFCHQVLAQESIPVLQSIIGDVDGSGAADNRDLFLLFRHLSGYVVDDIVQEALDVNGDEKVNNKDFTRLFKSLSGVFAAS